MKILNIALLDLTRNLRNYFGLAFMFGVPILLTGLFYFAFGGIRGDQGYTLPQTTVQVVNLDQPDPQVAQSFQQNLPGSLPDASSPESIRSLGDLVVNLLGSQGLSEIIQVSEVADAESARSAVDQQQAGVALIIPADFTNKMFSMQGGATLSIYKDPTLTLGPQIVEGIVQQLVDAFSSTQITIQVVQGSLSQAGITLDAADMQSIVMQVMDNSQQGQQGNTSLVEVHQPSGATSSTGEDRFHLIINNIMGGMMIFYAYFTGASTIQNIITEEERGTLQRLFTTPAPASMILGGKFLASSLTILVQMIVLLVFSRLVFGTQWGPLGLIAIYTVSTTLCAVAFGIFVISFLRTTRQAGAILGGVMPFTGMIGMVKVFAMGASFGPFMEIVPLFTPQGWSIRALMATLQGGNSGTVVVAALVLVVLAGVFFTIGNLRFKRRYA